MKKIAKKAIAKKPVEKPMPRGRKPKVEVTAMDIETAMRKKSGHCMIAQAIKRAFPEVRNVLVDFQTIRFSDPKKGMRYTYLTPASVMAPLIGWDQGIQPKPFPFRLHSPQITAMRVVQKDGSRKRTHKFGRKRRPQHQRAGRDAVTAGGRPPPVLGSGKDRVFGSRSLAHFLTSDALRNIQAVTAGVK